MGNFSAWRQQVDEWNNDYNEKGFKPPIAIEFNLTNVKIRVCAKCGTRDGRIHRHHKGHEYLFARLLPEHYAARYIKFVPSDIVMLCDKNKCHLKIHKLYQPRLAELWPLLEKQNGRITHEQAERFRQKLIRCCNNWLKRKKKVRRKK